MGKKKLCFYTAQYPYGLEEQFIETEIKHLAERFEQVFIFPGNTDGAQRPVPENVKIVNIDKSKYSSLKGLCSIGNWVLYCIGDVLRHKNKKFIISNLLQIAYSSIKLNKYLAKNNLQNAIHYSYWFDEWSTQLSILKSKKEINKYVSRAHGFDLYEYRKKDGFIPFRKFQLLKVSKLFLISEDGKNYIEKCYAQFKNKYEVSYLGTENHYPFTFNNKSAQYLIISCSRMVDIKRVDLIVKSLALIKDFKIKWVHFGGGMIFEEIEHISRNLLPPNIDWELKGMVSNFDVLKFYEMNNVDLFINLSSSEGLPVSIMEAISYGIPILATNVGGTKEIVNERTGILISKDADIFNISLKIKELLTSSSKNNDFRNGVFNFWQNNFNANKNYSCFISKLLRIVL